MKNSAFRACVLIGAAIAAAIATPPWAQTPITVQVINDSGVPDSAVYLLLAGQDVGVVSPSGQAINYPFAVSGVAATPVGTVTNTTGALVTNGGTTPAASAPLTVTSAATTIAMSFAPATIVSGGIATLTINLPNVNGAQPLTQPFTAAMPPGVTITSSQSTGTCTGVAVSATQVSMANGMLPANGCTIAVTVTSSTTGTVTATTSYLQTAPSNILPASAPLTVTATASAMTMAFQPASIAAALNSTSTLTISLPNAKIGRASCRERVYVLV